MNHTISDPGRRSRRIRRRTAVIVSLVFCSRPAHASMFQGETLDNIANVLSWIVLVVAPLIGIAVFLMIHILPEKIAEKRRHPQAKAIQCLCLLSLAFGGLLWPLAWLWAYSKPVLHKLAYGTDQAPHEHEPAEGAAATAEDAELRQLYQRVAELEAKRAGNVEHEERKL